MKSGHIEYIVENPVQGLSVRDGNSKAILNTSAKSLEAYKLQKHKMDVNREKAEISIDRVDRLSEEMDSMKNSLNRIEKMLATLLGNKDVSTIS